ncbi:molybdopterin cofactor-binding domain-containing protein [Roseomonas sp. CCTCC AB2023176]|uniref:molybdopterin cofactor-binding domain-containing protein n=1 Tax=Roseomonas sp. CCTCC AB2023176 TaxID=3342640 RepID=UPI0035E2DA4A
MDSPHLSRRAALGGFGALVVSLGAPVAPEMLARPAHAQGAPAQPVPPLPTQLSSYVAVAADGSVTAFFGKVDVGQGLDVAIAQVVAEELDVPPARVTVVMGDTRRCVDQGGASNASGVAQGSIPLRNAAAEARLLLTELAAERLGVAVERLRTTDGAVFVDGEPARRVTYGDLVAGRYFSTELRWNGRYGNILNVEGRARRSRRRPTPRSARRSPAATSPTRSSPATNTPPTPACPACGTPAWSARPSRGPRRSRWTKPRSATSRTSGSSTTAASSPSLRRASGTRSAPRTR